MRKLYCWQKPVLTHFHANRKQKLSAAEEINREVCLTPSYQFCTAVYFLTTSVSMLLLVFSSLVSIGSRTVIVAAVFQRACATRIHKMPAAAVIRIYLGWCVFSRGVGWRGS